MAPRNRNIGTRRQLWSISRPGRLIIRKKSSVPNQWEVWWAPEASGVPRNFVRGGGVQQIQVKAEDREKGDLGAIAP